MKSLVIAALLLLGSVGCNQALDCEAPAGRTYYASTLTSITSKCGGSGRIQLGKMSIDHGTLSVQVGECLSSEKDTLTESACGFSTRIACPGEAVKTLAVEFDADWTTGAGTLTSDDGCVYDVQLQLK